MDTWTGEKMSVVCDEPLVDFVHVGKQFRFKTRQSACAYPSRSRQLYFAWLIEYTRSKVQ